MKKLLSFLLTLVICWGLFGTSLAKEVEIPLTYGDYLVFDEDTPYSIITGSKGVRKAITFGVLGDILEYKPDFEFSFKTENTNPIYVAYNVAEPNMLLFFFRKTNKNYLLAGLVLQGKVHALVTDFTGEIPEDNIKAYFEDPYIKYIAYDETEMSDGFIDIAAMWKGNIYKTEWWDRLNPYNEKKKKK